MMKVLVFYEVTPYFRFVYVTPAHSTTLQQVNAIVNESTDITSQKTASLSYTRGCHVSNRSDFHFEIGMEYISKRLQLKFFPRRKKSLSYE